MNSGKCVKKFMLMTVYVVCLVLLILFLTSCANDQNKVTRDMNFRTGTDGLKMKFIASAPDKNVYLGSNFNIAIDLENKGAYEIKNGKLIFTIEDDYMKIPDGYSDDRINLKGKDEFGQGERAVKSVVATPLDFPETQSLKHTSLIIATACYGYETKASTPVCVDLDPYNLKASKSKVCRRQVRNLNSQGAPIAVISVDEQVLVQEDMVRPLYFITIQNRGQGQVYNKNILDSACSSTPVLRSDWNVIRLKDVYFSRYAYSKGEIKCEPENIVLDNTGKAVIKCSINQGIMTEQDTFQSDLGIDLEYGYSESVSVETTIVKTQGKIS